MNPTALRKYGYISVFTAIHALATVQLVFLNAGFAMGHSDVAAQGPSVLARFIQVMAAVFSFPFVTFFEWIEEGTNPSSAVFVCGAFIANSLTWALVTWYGAAWVSRRNRQRHAV